MAGFTHNEQKLTWDKSLLMAYAHAIDVDCGIINSTIRTAYEQWTARIGLLDQLC